MFSTSITIVTVFLEMAILNVQKKLNAEMHKIYNKILLIVEKYIIIVLKDRARANVTTVSNLYILRVRVA